MKKILFNFFLLTAGILVALQFAERTVACPSDLECANFTESAKINDCRYITNGDLSESEEEQLICGLWDQTYYYEKYNPPEYEFNIDLALTYKEIDNSRFILAGKIFAFGFLNYFLFSLTKSTVIVKWLTALS